MVEVGGSNPPGPTNKKPRHKRGFYWSIEVGRIATRFDKSRQASKTGSPKGKQPKLF